MKDKFLQLLNECKQNLLKVNNDFVELLELNGFFEAPASARFHLNNVGGLCEHTFNVVTQAKQLWKLDQFNKNVDRNSLLFCALMHDIGKIGWNGQSMYQDKILKSGKKSEATPYEKNKNCLQLPHEDISLFYVLGFYELTNDETFAIKYHNGAYDRNEMKISGKETPLMLALHFADMIAAKIVENPKYKKIDVAASFGEK